MWAFVFGLFILFIGEVACFFAKNHSVKKGFKIGNGYITLSFDTIEDSFSTIFHPCL